MTGRQQQFGMFDIFQVDPERLTRDSLLEHLGHHQLADELGLDYIFLAERHFLPMYRATSPGLLLANLATRTQHARLGVLGYTLAIHNPVFLAEEISTLDHLTNGRMEVGIGLGHRPEEISGLGLPVEHRQTIFLDCLLMMRDLWTGRPYSHDGVLFRVRDVLVHPPIQQPHPPVWYTGGNPEAAAWAKRNGLSLAVGFQPDESLTAPARAFHEETAPDDAPPARLALMRHIYVADSDEQAREEIISDLMRLGEQLAANPTGVPNAPTSPPTRQDAERQYQEQQDRQIVVSGGPEKVAGELARTIQTVETDVFLANVHLMGVEDERVRRTLTLFAEQVVPRVREILEAESTGNGD